MRWTGWLVLAAASACSSSATTPPAPNPLDTIDPSQGFVADARGTTGIALADASKAQVASRDRILFVADPLGVARLAAEIERERTYCKTPPCPVDVKIENAVTSYAQQSGKYTPILIAHHQLLERWAALAAAHQALGIANVLDQAGTLTDVGRTEIRDAASALLATSAALTYTTLDWSADPAVMTADPTIGSEILGHAPVIALLPATEAAALATVTAVLAEVDRDVQPLSPLCCTGKLAPTFGSPAYQTLRRLVLLREWQEKGDADAAITAYAAALASLAQKTLSGAAMDVTWSTFHTDSNAYAIEIATLLAVIRAAPIVEAPDVTSIFEIGPSPYDDLNARDPRPNVATANPVLLGAGWEARSPVVALRTSMWIPHVPLGDTYQPDYLEAPALSGPTPGTDGASEVNLAGPIVIEWDVQTSAPLDHLDLRIYRDDDTEPMIHYLERPLPAGFPSRTVFDPISMDPRGLLPGVIVAYRIEVVAVDVRGRPSDPVGSDIHVRAVESDKDQTYDQVLEAMTSLVVPRVRLDYSAGEAELEQGAAAEQVTIRSYSTTPGAFVHFEPSIVTMSSGSSSLTVTNQGLAPYHVVSVYTAPYVLDPSILSVAIGGVQTLDLGIVPVGATVSIPLPAGAVNYTHWTLFDVDDPNPNRQALRVRVRQ